MKTGTKHMGTMDPCFRYDTFKKNYPDFEGTFEEALELPLATFEDKMWLLKRMFSRQQLVDFALLSDGECGYPGDETLAKHYGDLYELIIKEATETNRRQTAKVTASIVNRVLAIEAHAAMEKTNDPSDYLKAKNKKQAELLEIAKEVSKCTTSPPST